MTRRSTYALLVLGFMVSVLLFTLSAIRQRQDTFQQAAAATNLTLSASRSSLSVGEEVVIAVQVDTGANQITVADLYLTFDTAVFDFVSLENGNFLPNLFIPPSVVNGVARIGVQAASFGAKSGSGNLVNLHLRAKQISTQSTINFGVDTAIAALDEEDGNVVVSQTPVAVSIVAQPQITPDTNMYMLPTDITINPGETLYLPIHINTQSNQVEKVDLVVTFDENKFEGVRISSGGYFPIIPRTPTIAGGVAKLVAEAAPNQPKQGIGVVAILELKAKSIQGLTGVSIDGSSSVKNVNSTLNVIAHLSGTAVIIGTIPSATPLACELPLVPRIISATALNSNQVELSWTATSGASHYGIVYGTLPKTYVFGAADVGTGTTFKISRLSPNTQYYFAVFAVNNCGTSTYSNEASALVPSAIGGANTKITSPTPKLPAGKVSPQPSFESIDPTSDEFAFLQNKPRASISPPPTLIIPDSYKSGLVSSTLFTPVRITVAVLVVLLIATFILFKRA